MYVRSFNACVDYVQNFHVHTLRIRIIQGAFTAAVKILKLH